MLFSTWKKSISNDETLAFNNKLDFNYKNKQKSDERVFSLLFSSFNKKKMVKTRSRTSTLVVKEEDLGDERGPTQILHETNTVTNSRVSKRNSHTLDDLQIKLEETDNKHLLQAVAKKRQGNHRITAEQVEQLIKYIEHDNLSITDASKKVNISRKSGQKYYRMYENDPEKRIPVPVFSVSYRSSLPLSSPSPSLTPSPPSSPEHESSPSGQEPSIRSVKETWVTQEQIKKLIHCIEHKKMTIHAAANRAKLGTVTGYKYYYMYKEDGKIPKPRNYQLYTFTKRTHGQVKDLIRYVEKDKISIIAASAKVKLSPSTSMKYFSEYKKTGRIPTPATSKETYCTVEQKRLLIDFLFNDKMTLQEASLNASMTLEAGIKYYTKQLVWPGLQVPPELKGSIGPYTNEQIKVLIGFVVNDKMSVEEALARVSARTDA
jgi:transposase